MRLQSDQTAIIQDAFEAVFKKGKLYLFGSRSDDIAKGGDIDLFIQPVGSQLKGN